MICYASDFVFWSLSSKRCATCYGSSCSTSHWLRSNQSRTPNEIGCCDASPSFVPPGCVFGLAPAVGVPVFSAVSARPVAILPFWMIEIKRTVNQQDQIKAGDFRYLFRMRSIDLSVLSRSALSRSGLSGRSRSRRSRSERNGGGALFSAIKRSCSRSGG